MGKRRDYSDEPAARTRKAYKKVFEKLRNLKQLDMKEPTLQILSLRSQQIMQLDGGSEMHTAGCLFRTYQDSPTLP